MTEEAVEKIVCRRCYTVLDSRDNFCRQCGLPTRKLEGWLSETGPRAPAITAPGTAPAPSPLAGFVENPWVVLGMLFFVLGPLALPMLWRSRRFNRIWKLVLTILVIVVTVVGLWLAWHQLNQALAPLRELDKIR